MNDLLTLARVVGVFDPEEHYQHQLWKAEMRRLHRIGTATSAIVFGVIVSTGLIWTQLVGAA